MAAATGNILVTISNIDPSGIVRAATSGKNFLRVLGGRRRLATVMPPLAPRAMIVSPG
jgi:hypothetical protein